MSKFHMAAAPAKERNCPALPVPPGIAVLALPSMAGIATCIAALPRARSPCGLPAAPLSNTPSGPRHACANCTLRSSAATWPLLRDPRPWPRASPASAAAMASLAGGSPDSAVTAICTDGLQGGTSLRFGHHQPLPCPLPLHRPLASSNSLHPLPAAAMPPHPPRPRSRCRPAAWRTAPSAPPPACPCSSGPQAARSRAATAQRGTASRRCRRGHELGHGGRHAASCSMPHSAASTPHCHPGQPCLHPLPAFAPYSPCLQLPHSPSPWCQARTPPRPARDVNHRAAWSGATGCSRERACSGSHGTAARLGKREQAQRHGVNAARQHAGHRTSSVPLRSTKPLFPCSTRSTPAQAGSATHRQHGGRDGRLLAALHQRSLGVHHEAQHLALGGCKGVGLGGVGRGGVAGAAHVEVGRHGDQDHSRPCSVQQTRLHTCRVLHPACPGAVARPGAVAHPSPAHRLSRCWRTGSRGRAGRSRRAPPAGPARPGPARGAAGRRVKPGKRAGRLQQTMAAAAKRPLWLGSAPLTHSECQDELLGLLLHRVAHFSGVRRAAAGAGQQAQPHTARLNR